MIIKHQPLEALASSDQIDQNTLFVDIETTGLSSKTHTIYALAMIYAQGPTLHFEQWFCEKAGDEYELLFRFNTYLAERPKVIHYNGDTFDMPFIKNRMLTYKLNMNPYISLDLLKVFRPYKKALTLPNLKLKTLERKFGYIRQDPYDGGQLIEQYHAYLQTRDVNLLDNLLNHNHEDLLGLLSVYRAKSLLNAISALKSDDSPLEILSSELTNGMYQAKVIMPKPIPLPTSQAIVIHLEKSLTISFEADYFLISIPSIVDELFYFFTDYKDYVYLFNEDYAIHKSIGIFVSKDHRVPATRETAYAKKHDFFLPLFGRPSFIDHPYCQKKDLKNTYASVEDLLEVDGFQDYIKHLLNQLP